MGAFALFGGFLYIAAVGYFIMGRLGRFLDRGGISPCWDEAEERQSARNAKKESANTDSFSELKGCNAPHSKVV